MKNVTALDFASLWSEMLLVGVLPKSEVAKKLRELADMIDIRTPPRLVLHEAYSMEQVQTNMVATTTLILRFYLQNPVPNEDFTEQEKEIFAAMALGLTISQTAQHMKMDEELFRRSMGNMCEKTGLGIAELFEFAKTKADYDAGKDPLSEGETSK
jgi:DNA-binding CsgD family transcriptional regulator